jgi:tripartite-type tricarboxylate transporter receptor subunit TctC
MKKLLAIFLLAPALALAWQPPAGKNITTTVGFAPGSGNEVSFRIIEAQVKKSRPDLTFVVNNRPGAGESIAVNWFAQQATDGTNL